MSWQGVPGQLAAQPVQMALGGGFERWPRGLARGLSRWLAPLCGLLLLLLCASPLWAADLQVSDIALAPCPEADPGRQPELRRPAGAACFALRGVVINTGSNAVVDTDVFGLVLDASGEPALPNRTRLGSIGDVPPGRTPFALRISIPAGTPGPFVAKRVKARGFAAPVRKRAGPDDELLPLERSVSSDSKSG
ncbi:MAG: hypothetical protein VKI42_03320 [Synechococcaceae cyanobacterium]|nr:hypothetical protein [Synechococcaceae cyanobacterium]